MAATVLDTPPSRTTPIAAGAPSLRNSTFARLLRFAVANVRRRPEWIDVSTGTWMTWLGSISAGCLVVALLVYVFGRRAAAKLSAPDALAHLAVLDKPADKLGDPEPADEPLAQA